MSINVFIVKITFIQLKSMNVVIKYRPMQLKQNRLIGDKLDYCVFKTLSLLLLLQKSYLFHLFIHIIYLQICIILSLLLCYICVMDRISFICK